MFAVFAPTLPAVSSRPSTERWIRSTVRSAARQQAGDDERGDEADDQRDRPVGVAGDRERRSSADRRLSQRPGRVQDPHARVVDPRDAVEPVGLVADHLDRLVGGLGLRWRSARQSATIVITIAAATAITTTPSTMPTVQPVDDAIVSTRPPCRNAGSIVTSGTPSSLRSTLSHRREVARSLGLSQESSRDHPAHFREHRRRLAAGTAGGSSARPWSRRSAPAPLDPGAQMLIDDRTNIEGSVTGGRRSPRSPSLRS